MGQYYLIVNTTKQQYIAPHDFGDGAKLMEFGPSGHGVMAGLAVLLADGNNRGGGDLRSDNPVIGSWRGDSIVVAGDYADPLPDSEENLYHAASDRYTNVSDDVLRALCDDGYTREDLAASLSWRADRLPADLFARLYPDGKVPDKAERTSDLAKEMAKQVVMGKTPLQPLLDRLSEEGVITMDGYQLTPVGKGRNATLRKLTKILWPDGEHSIWGVGMLDDIAQVLRKAGYGPKVRKGRR